MIVDGIEYERPRHRGGGTDHGLVVCWSQIAMDLGSQSRTDTYGDHQIVAEGYVYVLSEIE